MIFLRISLAAGITSAFLAVAAGAVEIGPEDDLEAAVSALVPGEELILRGGTYSFDENVTFSANGTAEQPIIIRGKTGEQPIITQATFLAHQKVLSGFSVVE